MPQKSGKYKTLSEAPEGWRTVRAVPLQLFQLNAIVELAELDEASGVPFPVAHGKRRAEFESSHVVVNGQWSPAEVH